MTRKFMYPLKCRFCGTRIRKATNQFTGARIIYEDDHEVGYYVCEPVNSKKEIQYHQPYSKEENIQKILSKIEHLA